MDSRYDVRSNRESGDGRYDIQLSPKVNSLPGILIELKAAGKTDNTDLTKLAGQALSQIREKHYDTEMLSRGVHEIIRYGVAFSGKNVEIAVE